MEELQLFRGDTVLIKGKKRKDTVRSDKKWRVIGNVIFLDLYLKP